MLQEKRGSTQLSRPKEKAFDENETYPQIVQNMDRKVQRSIEFGNRVKFMVKALKAREEREREKLHADPKDI